MLFGAQPPLGFAWVMEWRAQSQRHRITVQVNGAGEGIRTLDPNLGKVVLYP